MNQHPALTMIGVWGVCVVAYALLPYQLLYRELTFQGMVGLIVFVLAFVFGTLILPPASSKSPIVEPRRIDASKIELCLIAVSTLAIICLVLDIKGKDLLDLTTASELRSASAQALLKGEASNSSIWFKVAFLLYPASYIYIVVHVLYSRKVRIWKLVAFGLLPIMLATVTMGGRMPIFYGFIVLWLAIKERKKIVPSRPQQALRKPISRKWIIRFVWLSAALILLRYFIIVFMVRASTVGGSMKMFDVAEQLWGVSFRGPLSDIIFTLFGADIAYMIFVFPWYLVQGLVMSNYLFSDYNGPLQMGVYGIDLMSALMRRIDPQSVSEGFKYLLNLGTYGFFPSAWGSLYVDFGFYALILCVMWGIFTALCYQRIVIQKRPEWILIGPFVTIGIIFSLINTPLGFTNGFITHGWLLVVFLSLKRSRCPEQEPLR